MAAEAAAAAARRRPRRPRRPRGWRRRGRVHRAEEARTEVLLPGRGGRGGQLPDREGVPVHIAHGSAGDWEGLRITADPSIRVARPNKFQTVVPNKPEESSDRFFSIRKKVVEKYNSGSSFLLEVVRGQLWHHLFKQKKLQLDFRAPVPLAPSLASTAHNSTSPGALWVLKKMCPTEAYPAWVQGEPRLGNSSSALATKPWDLTGRAMWSSRTGQEVVRTCVWGSGSVAFSFQNKQCQKWSEISGSCKKGGRLSGPPFFWTWCCSI